MRNDKRVALLTLLVLGVSQRQFRQLLRRRARYLDAVDAGEVTAYVALLTGDQFSSEPLRVRQSDSRTDNVEFLTTRELLADLDELLAAIGRARRSGGAIVDAQRAIIAYDQAVPLRDACRAAIALAMDLRVSHVADARPAEAPIYEYTAAVEGFTVIRDVRYELESDSLIVAMASGYVYRMAGDAVRAADHVHSESRIGTVTVMFGGGAARIAYEDGAESD